MFQTEKNTKASKKGWAHLLFVKHPRLYLPELLKMEYVAKDEVDGICRILDNFKIERNSKILDFSCGIGRHAVRLASKGYNVIGYDPSEFFLKMARQRVTDSSLKKRLRFYQGEPKWVSKILSNYNEVGFRAIIIMFNSLGYCGTDEDLITLQKLLAISSKEGCILITQTENRDWRLKNFQPYIISDYDNLQVNERWQFNLSNSTSEGNWKFYKKNDRKRTLRLVLDLRLSQRMYSLHELKQLLDKSGWKYIKSYGDLKHLQQVSPDTQEIITVSQS